MDLRDYLEVVRKHWLSTVAIAAFGASAALVGSILTTPVYVSTTQLYVSVQSGSTTSDMLQGANFTRQQVSSYARLVTSPLVLAPVIDELALDTRVDTLAARVTAESPLNSSLINIGVKSESSAMSAATANAIADQFRAVVSELERPNDGGPSTVKLTVVRTAVAPEAPTEPKTTINVLLGGLVGAALGALIALLRNLLDTRVHDSSVASQIVDASVVGVIGFDSDAADSPLIVQSDPHSPRAEAFRRLRTNVQFLGAGGRRKSIVVASSLPGEGKSTTSINLAIALADAGVRVALVDADLRRPSVARYLGIEGSAGLTTVLIGRAKVGDVIQPWGNGLLDVLPSGQIPPNPSELLGSKQMAQVVACLEETHDLVLIDTPPLLPVTDAAVLAKLAGGALVVVGAGRVRRQQLSEAIAALNSVDAHVLGLVVNHEPRRTGSGYDYYRYAEMSGPQKSDARRHTGKRNQRGWGRRNSAPDTNRVAGIVPPGDVGTGHAGTAWPPTQPLGGVDAAGSSPSPAQHAQTTH
ncbi:polysaccharide biosynthesis tyrosine autokinase [Cellulomonas dongxiuzhuiae]|uniref:Polysaccharide biosynthesis tyrosine autokinase n=1 Tax=Cellulomonas dongxiuzhuiae TaxID=2819979 RepID=A0ABX8GL55_9CELL|nr:polysaccharide biosynthesis tyrosine autokinase [Cellulomonas dongxiuzhuiae]MBO3096357.1 polysaccharide biosynthesis tyrosine autokinase [Cellulomonas dongxiuzhuiae]QWC16770.1 polysaccharide biosynthesis tyrosine autokinase [Cellulomonas dongxiuzhuiae]